MHGGDGHATAPPATPVNRQTFAEMIAGGRPLPGSVPRNTIILYTYTASILRLAAST